jgi:hypothetical protein
LWLDSDRVIDCISSKQKNSRDLDLVSELLKFSPMQFAFREDLLLGLDLVNVLSL